MKLVLALLFVSCGASNVPPPKVQATIVGTYAAKEDGDIDNRTYLKDEHGHYNDVRGIWGEVGDIVYVTCHNGYLIIK